MVPLFFPAPDGLTLTVVIAALTIWALKHLSSIFPHTFNAIDQLLAEMIRKRR